MNSLAHGPLLHLQSHGTASSLSDSASLCFCHMAFFSSVVKAISFPLVWHTWLNLRPTQIIQDNLPISRILIDSHLQSPFFSPTKVTLTWFPGGSVVMNPPANTGSLSGVGRSLEEEMATHSSVLAWEIPWTEEIGGLRSVESQRVRHDLLTKQKQQQINAASAKYMLKVEQPSKEETLGWTSCLVE